MRQIVKLGIGFCCFLPGAFASLIQSTPSEVNINGTGFGNVSTLITLQTANGMSTSEAGCIGFQSSNTTCGITQVGKIKNTSSLEPVPSGVTDASNLRFVFNAAQPSGASITLQQLEVSFYGTSGLLFTANLSSSLAPLTLKSTIAGTGNSGFVFQLNPDEAATANGILSSTTEIGAGFSATGASGGPDTLFLETTPGVSSSVPEPASYALLGFGLLFGGLLRKKLAS
jgi:hypothetical protein